MTSFSDQVDAHVEAIAVNEEVCFHEEFIKDNNEAEDKTKKVRSSESLERSETNSKNTSQSSCVIALPTPELLFANTQSIKSSERTEQWLDDTELSNFNLLINVPRENDQVLLEEHNIQSKEFQESDGLEQTFKRKRSTSKASKVNNSTKKSKTKLIKQSNEITVDKASLNNQDKKEIQEPTATSEVFDKKGNKAVERKARKAIEVRKAKQEALRLLRASNKQVRKQAQSINLKQLFEQSILSKDEHTNNYNENVNDCCFSISENEKSNNNINNNSNSNIETNHVDDKTKEKIASVVNESIPSSKHNSTCAPLSLSSTGKKPNLFSSPTLYSPLSLTTAWSPNLISELTQSVLEDVKEQQRMRMARILPRKQNRSFHHYSLKSRVGNCNKRELCNNTSHSVPITAFSPSNSYSQSIWENSCETSVNNSNTQQEQYEHEEYQWCTSNKEASQAATEEILVIGERDEIYESNTCSAEETTNQQQEQQEANNAINNRDKQQQQQQEEEEEEEEEEEALFFVPTFSPTVNDRSVAMLSAEREKMLSFASENTFGLNTDESIHKEYDNSSTQLSTMHSWSQLHSPFTNELQTQRVLSPLEHNVTSTTSFSTIQSARSLPYNAEAERATAQALSRKREMWKLKQRLLKSQQKLEESCEGANNSKSLLKKTAISGISPLMPFDASKSQETSFVPSIHLDKEDGDDDDLLDHVNTIGSCTTVYSNNINSSVNTGHTNFTSRFTPFSPLSNSMSTLSSSGEASTSMSMHDTPKLKLSDETLSFIRRMNNFDNTSTQKIVIFDPVVKSKVS